MYPPKLKVLGVLKNFLFGADALSVAPKLPYNSPPPLHSWQDGIPLLLHLPPAENDETITDQIERFRVHVLKSEIMMMYMP